MCRFTFYRGQSLSVSSLITAPENSLIHQSFHAHEREEPLNGDGFGLAWYAPGHPEPAVFRSVTPAWSNRNLLELARVVESQCILAHVRAATQVRAVNEANCHPFKHGSLAFMHNGDLGGFHLLRRELLAGLGETAFEAILGTTDSEHLFALVIDEAEKDGALPSGAAALADVLERALRRALGLAARIAPQEHSYLNLVLTDGRSAVAARLTTDRPEHADSLYVSRGRRYVCDGETCRMVVAEDAARAVLVSSEPLSVDPVWEAVPVGSLVLVDPDLSVEIRPARIAPDAGAPGAASRAG